MAHESIYYTLLVRIRFDRKYKLMSNADPVEFMPIINDDDTVDMSFKSASSFVVIDTLGNVVTAHVAGS